MRAGVVTRLFLACFGFACACPFSAWADEAVGVMDRPRPDYDAKGLPLGGFRLRPALDIGATATDNVFATQAGKENDIYYSITPSFDLKSDWSRHQIELKGSLTRYQYSKHSSESRTDWDIGASARIDVLRGTMIEGASSYSMSHEPRYSPDQPGGAKRPTEFSLAHSEVTFTHQPNRFGISLGANFDRFDFSPTPLIGGGEFNNDDRNRDQYGVFAKVSYAVTPDMGVFLRGAYDQHRYDQNIDHNGFDRDSNAYHVGAGLEFFPTHLIKGELFGGYVNESFKKPFNNTSAFDYGAKLTWYATPLMTLHLTASRMFNDTTIIGASATDDQSFGASLDYELLRNLILQTSVNYTDRKFDGITRDDKYLEAAFNAKWLINRYMSANIGYVYTNRNSSVPGQDFTDNAVMAGLHLQL
jgi:hypothetical protein